VQQQEHGGRAEHRHAGAEGDAAGKQQEHRDQQRPEVRDEGEHRGGRSPEHRVGQVDRPERQSRWRTPRAMLMRQIVLMKRPMSRSAWRMPASTRARVRGSVIAAAVRSTSQRSVASRKNSRMTVAEAETANDSVPPIASRVKVQPSIASRSLSGSGIGGAGAGPAGEGRRRGVGKERVAPAWTGLDQLVDDQRRARPPGRGRCGDQGEDQHHQRQHGADDDRRAEVLVDTHALQHPHRRREHEGEDDGDRHRKQQRPGVLEQQHDGDEQQPAAEPREGRVR
jgi:hypothetical protein